MFTCNSVLFLYLLSYLVDTDAAQHITNDLRFTQPLRLFFNMQLLQLHGAFMRPDYLK